MKTQKVTFGNMLFALGIILTQVFSIVLLFKGHAQGVLLATITFGDTTAPSVISKYFDSVFTQSLPNARGVLVDQIGALNSVLHSIMDSDAYESADGGTHIEEELMYALSPMESYDGFDELSTVETDGVTAAIYEWRQLATPVMYSMKQLMQNKRKILSFVKTKMTQMQMGIEEGFAQHLMWGSGAGALATPKTNPINASLSINPLSLIIKHTPTVGVVGNIDPSTSSWWANKTKSSSATTGDQFIAEWMNLYNSCALGTGGAPNLCLADQETYEIAAMALYKRYRQTGSDENFPFTNIRIPFGNGKSLLVLDDKVPDVENGLTTTGTAGTMYMVNTKFLKLRYVEGRDFEMLEDENGKTFVKPALQDARVGHCAWMGQLTTNNRRKHGVMYGIARSAAFTF